jgi:hypothetical protein
MTWLTSAVGRTRTVGPAWWCGPDGPVHRVLLPGSADHDQCSRISCTGARAAAHQSATSRRWRLRAWHRRRLSGAIWPAPDSAVVAPIQPSHQRTGHVNTRCCGAGGGSATTAGAGARRRCDSSTPDTALGPTPDTSRYGLSGCWLPSALATGSSGPLVSLGRPWGESLPPTGPAGDRSCALMDRRWTGEPMDRGADGPGTRVGDPAGTCVPIACVIVGLVDVGWSRSMGRPRPHAAGSAGDLSVRLN